MRHPLPQSKSLPWDTVEKKIKEEKQWLRSVLDIVPDEGSSFPITCAECLLRNIAVLIISGQVKATQINRTFPSESFWLARKYSQNVAGPKIRHGQEWHSRTMGKIEHYFLSNGYKVKREPNMQWGRADLGAYKKGELDLLIEVGTTSLFKVWINLAALNNFIYLMAPGDDLLVEFIIKRKKDVRSAMFQ